MSLRLIALASMAALALAACGKRGPLDQPPPMWGEKAKADYAAEQAAKKKAEADKAERSGPSANAPLPMDPAQKNTTIRQAPVEGGPTDPYKGPGQPL